MAARGPSPLRKPVQPSTGRRTRSAAASTPQPIAWGDWDSPRPRSQANQAAKRSQQLQQQLVALVPPRSVCAPTPSLDRPSAPQLMQWVERELQINGLQGAGPCPERVRVLSEALSQVIELLPSFKPILLSVKKEYDSLLEQMQTQLFALRPMEGRMKTIAAERYFLVGQSMTWFQMEIASLRTRLASAEARRDELTKEVEQLREENTKLKEAHDSSKSQAIDLQEQNLDICRSLERMERQVEHLRATERAMYGANGLLKTQARERELRMQSVEDQLHTEREKVLCMVPREDLEALKNSLRTQDATIKEQGEKLDAKQKDYMSLVEIYSKKIGQTLGEGIEGRPLTPRPIWLHCQGLLDPHELHSTEKAAATQQLLQHMLQLSRSLLSAYGLFSVGHSSRFRHISKHGVLLSKGDAAEDGFPSGTGHIVAAAPQVAPTTSNGRTNTMDNVWLPPDLDEETPPALRHPGKIKNLHFSRRKISDVIESILALRSRHGNDSLSRPFADFMLDHLPDYVKREEALEFVINIYAGLRRFSAEPTFLAYLLLLQGKLSDTVIKDNMAFCAELLRLLDSSFQKEDGSRTMTKTMFYCALSQVLRNKDKDRLEHIQKECMPCGVADRVVNFGCLLVDDPYVLSPVVFALRVQHLEESLELSERLERAIRGCVTDGKSIVTYEKVEAAFKSDTELQSLLQAEDFARAFGCTSIRALKPTSEQKVDRLIELMKHGDVFRLLFFPMVHIEEPESQRQETT